MVHFNVSIPAPMADVSNGPCQHAFMMVGLDTIFGVHLTQYHDDKHRYQVIVRLGLPKDVRKEFLRMRGEHPDASFLFCNGEQGGERFSIPALGSGNIDKGDQPDVMKGNIFFGFRPPKTIPPPPHWFPWNLDDTIPMIKDVELTVERIVLYRPFSLQDHAPDKATYLIFGKGDEAHMTNIQTGRLLSGADEIPLYGLDVDHVMSLENAPDWLSKDMLEAGTVVTLPCIDRRGDEGELIIHEAPPFDNGDTVHCLYRGLQPPWPLTAGQTFFWSGEVCNSPELAGVTPGMSMIITDMPKRFWR